MRRLEVVGSRPGRAAPSYGRSFVRSRRGYVLRRGRRSAAQRSPRGWPAPLSACPDDSAPGGGAGRCSVRPGSRGKPNVTTDLSEHRPAEGRRVSPGECPFCAIVAGRAPARVVRRWPDSLAIVPLSAVTAGHTLVIPKTHVADVGVDPAVSAATMGRAAELAAEFGACNIITSRGELATQSVFHLHLHVLPRRQQDGLALPWATGRSVVIPRGPIVFQPPFIG
ncbi:HIT domain-containing protein [Streptomyces phaeochromogenes]